MRVARGKPPIPNTLAYKPFRSRRQLQLYAPRRAAAQLNHRHPASRHNNVDGRRFQSANRSSQHVAQPPGLCWATQPHAGLSTHEDNATAAAQRQRRHARLGDACSTKLRPQVAAQPRQQQHHGLKLAVESQQQLGFKATVEQRRRRQQHRSCRLAVSHADSGCGHLAPCAFARFAG
jgi:hypothetical protein